MLHANTLWCKSDLWNLEMNSFDQSTLCNAFRLEINGYSFSFPTNSRKLCLATIFHQYFQKGHIQAFDSHLRYISDGLETDAIAA